MELLPGQLTHVFLISILDAALLSWLALVWYRRSVRHLMGQRGSPSAPAAPPAPPREAVAGAAQPLAFALFEPGRPPREALLPHGKRRLAAAYCVGALLFGATITALKLSHQVPYAPAIPDERQPRQESGVEYRNQEDVRQLAGQQLHRPPSFELPMARPV